jgi:hypothetical protein
VASHRIDLGNQGDAQLIGKLGRGDGGPKTGRTTSHDQDVVRDRLQGRRPFRG